MIGRSLAPGGEEAEWNGPDGRMMGSDRQGNARMPSAVVLCCAVLYCTVLYEVVVPRLVKPLCDRTVVLGLKASQLVVGWNSNISWSKTFDTVCDRAFHEGVETAVLLS